MHGTVVALQTQSSNRVGYSKRGIRGKCMHSSDCGESDMKSAPYILPKILSSLFLFAANRLCIRASDVSSNLTV